MSPDRRVKRFLLNLDELGFLLAGTHRVVKRPLPPDHVILFPPAWNTLYGAWEITVRSETYPPIEALDPILFENGPVIAEIQ